MFGEINISFNKGNKSMKKVILFGAGNELKNVLKYLNRNHVKVIAIVDNDPNKRGMKIGNIRVLSPQFLKQAKFDAILITSSAFYKEIGEDLRRMKVKNVLPVYSPNLEKNEKCIFAYCINLYGKCVLWYRNLCIRQEFYPSFAGIVLNPYFFARRGLLKYIFENRNYISGRCLDFGCGTKPYEQLFSTTEYIGVEIKSEVEKPDIVYYDGKTLPFRNDYFDCIICSQVFEHIPNLDEIVSEFYRVLKPGGYVLFTVPFAYPEHLIPFDFRRFTSYGTKMLVEEKGFQIIKYQKSGNAIETITQMKNVYFNEKIFVGKRRFRGLKRMGICLINLKGLVLSRLLKEDKDLYLDNIVVARKCE